MSFTLITYLVSNGLIKAILKNQHGIIVARLSEPVRTCEEALIAARQFEADNPDLFADHVLVDVSAEVERKSPELFVDGELTPVPEIE